MVGWALALAALVSWPADAGPLASGGLDSDDAAWFYNRPGATLAQMNADHGECRVFGGRMMGSTRTAPNPQYGLVGDIIGAIAAAGPAAALADDCMMSKGYRRYDVPNTRLRDFLRRYAQLPVETQALYAGAETPPEGILTRVWANDYWLAEDGAPLRADARSFTPVAPDVATFNQWGQPRRIRPAAGAPAAPAGGDAIVFLTLRGPSSRAFVMFDRRDPVTGLGSRAPVGGRERWPGFEASTEAEGSVAQLAFVIPAGVYALANVRTGRYDFTGFCLGTIAFEARAGEVIDLGEITVVPGDVVVDPLSPPPQARLRIVQPESDAVRAQALGAVAFADRLQSAAYYNDFPRQCQLFNRIYGIDMPGAASWGARAAK